MVWSVQIIMVGGANGRVEHVAVTTALEMVHTVHTAPGHYLVDPMYVCTYIRTVDPRLSGPRL